MAFSLKTDAVMDPEGRFVRSRLLGEVRHAVSTRALVEDASERAELAVRLRGVMGWGEDVRIALAEQVHGTQVAVVHGSNGVFAGGSRIAEYPGADALVSDSPDVMLGIFTADCVPILFADAQAGVIGAVHAGWRSTYGRILTAALHEAFALGARPERTKAWIGPAISGAAYEVSADLAEQFVSEFPALAPQVVEGRYLDLPRLNALLAASEGLPEEHIAWSGLCTKTRRDLFCSFRADGEGAGRMVSAIVL